MQVKQASNLLASVIILYLIVASCANPVAPTGGLKDETSPEFLGSEPVNHARNFDADKIDLAFDEFVVLKELNKQLLISPPLEEKLDVKTKGKGVRIKFAKDEVLVENTTYTIYFGDAIVDLHESNPLPNFQYVFSTGQEIDSLSIRGKVLDAQFLLPSAGVFVCLYLDNNDTLSLEELPLNVRPFYVAKTNDEGLFEINNIRYDKYLIFAVKDVNSNYFKDMPNEAIAFANDLILPEEVFDFIPDTIPVDTSNIELMDSLWANYGVQVTKQTYTLLLYDTQDSVQRLLKDEVIDNNRLHFEFKYPLKDSVIFNVLNTDSTADRIYFIEEYSVNMDSLDLWFVKPFVDTLRLRMVVDTLQVDTLEVLLNEMVEKELPKAKKGRSSKKSTTLALPSIEYTSNFIPDFPFFATGRIEFKTPIKSENFENCTLLEDNVPVPFKIEFTDPLKRKLLVEYPWKEKTKYRFEIPDQALTDIYGTKNDTIITRFTTTEESNYGVLEISITLPEESDYYWLVQLFKGSEDQEQILDFATIKESGNIVFKHLGLDKYRIKILEDRDNNGKWTSGNYDEKRLPEKFYYFPTVIEMKPGWKIEEDWEINSKSQENSSVITKKK